MVIIFEMGDLLTVEGQKYITLEVLTFENENYAFVNKLTDKRNITNEFYIFKEVNNGIKIIEEETTKNILLPLFQEKIKKDIGEILNS